MSLVYILAMATAWICASVILAVAIGKGISAADRRDRDELARRRRMNEALGDKR